MVFPQVGVPDPADMKDVLKERKVRERVFLEQLLDGSKLESYVIDVPIKAELRKYQQVNNRLLDSLVVECWHQVQEVPDSIPSQGPRHTKDVIKMVPIVPLS